MCLTRDPFLLQSNPYRTLFLLSFPSYFHFILFVFFLFFLWIFYVPSRPAVIFHAEISTLDHGACRRLVLLLFEIETKLRPRYALNPISDTLLPSHLRLSSVSSIVWYKTLPALIHYLNEPLPNEMKPSMLLRASISNKYFDKILNSFALFKDIFFLRYCIILH